ncbi:MAG: NADH-quinone oxidoreductase subunit NuoK [Planctomycetes bacterium]|nr:NADH-quinone oxidoreductase subunit NuoK [Planctomycetota bacterium]
MVTLNHYLLLGAAMFAIGIYGVLTRRNILGILISLELMFNAAMVNFAAFNAFTPDGKPRVMPFQGQALPELHGQVFALFIILVAAAEAVVGLALVLAIYRNLKSIYVEHLNLLKW